MPGDFIGLAPGAIRYSLLLSAYGGILDDVMGTRTGEALAIVVNGATKQADVAHLRAHLPPSLELVHHEGLALLALQGPDAAAVLDALVPGVAGLRFMRWGSFPWGGATLSVSRSGYTGEDGFEISADPETAEALARHLLADQRVKPIGLGARDSLRLEAGLPLYGHDLGPDTSPIEAGLAFAISKRRKVEGGFPGAERILAELLDGPKRKRVGLRLEGRQPAREGTAILCGDLPVGTVTSGGYGPSVEAPIAMGYVAAADAADGTALDLEVRGRCLPATVVPLPFWQKHYVR
jgi:aminomethyltransferase